MSRIILKWMYGYGNHQHLFPSGGISFFPFSCKFQLKPFNTTFTDELSGCIKNGAFLDCVRFEVFTAVTMKNAIIWDDTPQKTAFFNFLVI
jgi:hypothetical protein